MNPRSALGVAAVAAVGVALLGWQVATGGPLVRLDTAVRAHLLAADVPALRHLSDALTYLGWAVLAVPVLLLCARQYGLRRGDPQPLAVAVAASAGLAVTVLVLKALLARPGTDGRPAAFLSGAWPSGHTATATVVFLLLARLVGGDTPGRRAARAACRAVPLVVAVSLLYSDYHWLSDVLAGYLLGIALVCAASALPRRPRPLLGPAGPAARSTAPQNRA